MQDTYHRQTIAAKWVAEQLGIPHTESGSKLKISVVAGDASARRYFRLSYKKQTYVLMDAPPEQEDCRPFVDITQRLLTAGLHAPAIIRSDMQNGFLLLEDLGDQLYRDYLDIHNVQLQYDPVFTVLMRLFNTVDTTGLPEYDARRLQTELDLFKHWYAPYHCESPLSASELETWHSICTLLIVSVEEQPQGFVHRDFHSCNLLHIPDSQPGIIDYQDAVIGPVSYDLVSWLLDRYHTWPRHQLESWYEAFRRQMNIPVSTDQWLRWCDWMGVQRNLKILGIFARLAYRDKKISYLTLMPRFYDYIIDAAHRYTELQPLIALLQKRLP